MLQNEVSKAKGPIELFDTEPKPEDRPRRAAAPEEGAKTAIAQKARKGVSDALQGGKAAPGLKAERCGLPAREFHEERELIVPPPRARAQAIGDGSVTHCAVREMSSGQRCAEHWQRGNTSSRSNLGCSGLVNVQQ